jgi:transcriptional regulator with XRE-family HTH domain
MNRLKELRLSSEMKQEDLASRLSVKRQTVSRYENGLLDLDTATVARICAIFNCTSDYLLCISDRRDPELTPEEIELLAAYHAASPEIRKNVDFMLEPYRQEKETAAG